MQGSSTPPSTPTDRPSPGDNRPESAGAPSTVPGSTRSAQVAGLTPGEDASRPPMSPDEAARAAAEIAEETHVHLVTPERHPWRSILGLVLGIAVLGGLSAAFILYPINWQVVGRWGYLGVSAVVFVATASVALPIPYLLIVARAGTYLDPVMIGLVAGLAGMLGEMTGYLIGMSGSQIVPHGKWYDRARGWICTYGFWCIAVFAAVPNPFFDAIGLAAGTLRYSWWRFALSCFLGKAIKFFIAAWIGVEALRFGWIN